MPIDDSQFLFSGLPDYAEPPSAKKQSSGWCRSCARHFLFFLAVLYFGLIIAGPAIDAACVKGRLSEVQVRAINEQEWNKCPKYMNGKCEALKYDRVLSGECSNRSRTILFRDQVNDVTKWWRKL